MVRTLFGPKPYKSIGFGGIHGPKPYKSIGFGGIHGPRAFPGASSKAFLIHFRNIFFALALLPVPVWRRDHSPKYPGDAREPKYTRDPGPTRDPGYTWVPSYTRATGFTAGPVDPSSRAYAGAGVDPGSRASRRFSDITKHLAGHPFT